MRGAGYPAQEQAMRFLGIFCLLFGGLQWGSLLWYYRVNLNLLLANWTHWGTLVLASMLILAGLSLVFKPMMLAVRLFAVTAAFYLLGLYAEILPLFQGQLIQKFGMGAQIVVVLGGIIVLRLSYGLISKPLLKKLAAQQREQRFVSSMSKEFPVKRPEE